jgi:hypothetical protein
MRKLTIHHSILLFAVLLVLFTTNAGALLTGHVEATTDLLFLALDSDYDGSITDETWYQTFAAKLGAGDVGTASTLDYEDTMTDGNNLPKGSAVKTYGDTNWYSSLEEGTNPTAAAGTIKHDTTAAQLLAGSSIVYHPDTSVPAVIELLSSDDDDYEFYTATYPQTVRKIGVHCEGVCTTPATFSFTDRAGNALTVGSITVSTGTGNTSFATVSAGGSLVTGEGLKLNVTNTPNPDATDKYIVIIETRAVRQ